MQIYENATQLTAYNNNANNIYGKNSFAAFTYAMEIGMGLSTEW